MKKTILAFLFSFVTFFNVPWIIRKLFSPSDFDIRIIEIKTNEVVAIIVHTKTKMYVSQFEFFKSEFKGTHPFWNTTVITQDKPIYYSYPLDDTFGATLHIQSLPPIPFLRFLREYEETYGEIMYLKTGMVKAEELISEFGL